MSQEHRHIYTFHEKMISREQKEGLLKQRACTVWLTGLSGSGKTTIARAVEAELAQRGFLTQLLDGDNIRDGINADLGFSEEDRRENIRRIAEINKLFNSCGVITINCFISPTREIRNMAKSIIGSDLFLEVFIDTPLEVCESRDVKGLYKKARAGEIRNFTGIDAPFEAPENPDLRIKTAGESIEASTKKLLNFLQTRIAY
jgi:adenylylsulfate kinase